MQNPSLCLKKQLRSFFFTLFGVQKLIVCKYNIGSVSKNYVYNVKHIVIAAPASHPHMWGTEL